MRLRFSFVVAGLAAAVPVMAQPPLPPDPPHVIVRDAVRTPRAYQGRDTGPEQTERFSRKVKLGRDGRVSIANISGDITVTGGAGDDVSIEAVKRTHGDKSELALVQITVDDRAGRVDVRTEGEQNGTGRRRGNSVSVDYTVTVPASAAVELHSISGSVKMTGVHGSARAETISGNVTAIDTPKLEAAKSVSGDVSFSGVTDGDVSAGSISGNVSGKGVKARGLDLNSVSGSITLVDVACERLTIKSVSGSVEYSGTMAKAGRYEISSHSGSVRLAFANPPGFELSASSFSGSIRSELPLTIGGDAATGNGTGSGSGNNSDRRRTSTSVNSHNLRATFGDGSATLSVRTFSGDVVIAKR